MPLVDRTEPLTTADRDRAAAAAPDPREAGSPLVPSLLLTFGAAAAAGAFSIIATRVAFAAILLIAGTVAAVAGGPLLLMQRAFRRFLAKERAEYDRAMAQGLARILHLTADAAWAAPANDEDCGAVLLRVEPGRFVYFNASWVDEPARGDDDAQTFPATTRIISLASSFTLRIEHDPPMLPLRDDLPDDDDALAAIEHWAVRGDGEMSILNTADLPASWTAIVTGATSEAPGHHP